MPASQGKQPKSGRVEMPPWLLCTEAGLELRGIRFQIESLFSSEESFFRDSSDENKVAFSCKSGRHFHYIYNVCAKVS